MNRFFRPALALALGICLALTAQGSAQAFTIGGAIRVEYDQAGGSAFFGTATNAESNAERNGKWQSFSKGSSIYWNAGVSNGHANQIGGLIRQKWASLDYERSSLRYPTTRELVARKPGRYNKFEGGSIYYSANSGTHTVYAGIFAKWGTTDYENGPFGFPTTDEFKCVSDAAQNGDSEGTYGGIGQLFQGGLLTYDAPNNFIRGQDHSNVVGSDRKFYYGGQSEFDDFVNQGVNSWSALGRISFQKIAIPDPLITDYLAVQDYSDSSSIQVGFYGYRGPGTPDFLQFNTPKMRLQKDAGKLNVAMHELGHAQGLGHSCEGQLMDPYTTEITTIEAIDRSSYMSLWG